MNIFIASMPLFAQYPPNRSLSPATIDIASLIERIACTINFLQHNLVTAAIQLQVKITACASYDDHSMILQPDDK